MTIAERNPCPDCKCTPSYMAGVNVPFGDASLAYLVCWNDGKMRAVQPNATWESFGKKPPKPEWKKFSSVHWQMVIDGDVLDYWPTKSKWRYRGKTQSGNVNKFIRYHRQRAA